LGVVVPVALLQTETSEGKKIKKGIGTPIRKNRGVDWPWKEAIAS
jgi:hypothetical protein